MKVLADVEQVNKLIVAELGFGSNTNVLIDFIATGDNQDATAIKTAEVIANLIAEIEDSVDSILSTNDIPTYAKIQISISFIVSGVEKIKREIEQATGDFNPKEIARQIDLPISEEAVQEAREMVVVPVPTNLQGAITVSGITLTWNGIEADIYNVYRNG